MGSVTRASLLFALLVAAVAASIGASGCGSDDDVTATALNMSIAEEGKTASFTVPKSTKGGLVTLTLTNEGKAPHGAQLVRYEDGHSAEEVLKEISGESEKTPDWIRGEGGIGAVAPGKTGKATLNLEAGNFLVTDAASFGGKPATAELEVTDGDEGDLPETPATISAEEDGDDEFAWGIDGLAAGNNKITFDSEGDDTIHLVIAAPVKGKAPPVDQIKQELANENGPPPKWLDFEAAQSTAVLDSGKSQTLEMELEAGEYVIFCPLKDRDGKGKSHDQEGLLTVETVK